MSYIRPPFVLLFLLTIGWSVWAERRAPADEAFVHASEAKGAPAEVLR